MKIFISDAILKFFEKNTSNTNIVFPLLNDLYKLQKTNQLVGWTKNQRAKHILESRCGPNQSYRFYATIENNGQGSEQLLKIVSIGDKAKGEKNQNTDITLAETNYDKCDYINIDYWPVYQNYVQSKTSSDMAPQNKDENIVQVANASPALSEENKIRAKIPETNYKTSDITACKFHRANLLAWLNEKSVIKMADKKDLVKIIHNIKNTFDFNKNNITGLLLSDNSHIIHVRIDCPNNHKKRRAYAILCQYEDFILKFLYWKVCPFDITDTELQKLFDDVMPLLPQKYSAEDFIDVTEFTNIVNNTLATNKTNEKPEPANVPEPKAEHSEQTESKDDKTENISSGPVIYSMSVSMSAIQKLEKSIDLNTWHIQRYEHYRDKAYNYLISTKNVSSADVQRIVNNRFIAECKIKELQNANLAKRLEIQKMLSKTSQKTK